MAISTMLVPVGAESDERLILRYVSGLAVQSVRRVLVATSIDGTGMEAPVVAAEVDRARQRLAEWTADLAHNCPMQIETRVVTGDPSTSILALAEQADVDVVCCATHGKSALEALVWGSISEDLFASGKVRTMTVRTDLLEAAKDPAQIARDFAKRLVVPTDFSASATRAWLSAVERPAEAIGSLTAVHVLRPGDEEERQNAEVLLRGLLDIAREYGIEAQSAVVAGHDAAQAVLDYLEIHSATGVITGQRGRGGFQRVILGGLSLRLLREAPCPVVVQP